MQISTKVESIPEALSIYINQLVYTQKRKGKDITVLSLGEAFFDIPMFSFTALDFVKGYHYSDSRGIPELRERICAFYKKQYAASIDPSSEIIISAGSKPIIFFAMLATINPGEEVLIHEPGWLSYQEHARLIGATPTYIPYDCPVAEFHKHFTAKTKMLVINNPNNPAGRIYTLEELKSLYQQCRPRGIYILVDEAYSDFIIDDQFHSMAKVVPDKDGIIVVNSLSKNMGMSGWRVGYCITSKALIPHILKVNQHLITCAPTILQYYMAQYFDDVTNCTLPQVRETVEKRKRVAQQMEQLHLKKIAGGSTFYFLVSIDSFPGSSLDFALELLFNYQIAVVPGSAYGKSTARFVRVGVGTESEERIHDALMSIKDLSTVKAHTPQLVRDRMLKEGFHVFEER